MGVERQQQDAGLIRRVFVLGRPTATLALREQHLRNLPLIVELRGEGKAVGPGRMKLPARWGAEAISQWFATFSAQSRTPPMQTPRLADKFANGCGPSAVGRGPHAPCCAAYSASTIKAFENFKATAGRTGLSYAWRHAGAMCGEVGVEI